MSETQKYPEDLLQTPQQPAEHSRRTILKAFGAVLVGGTAGVAIEKKLNGNAAKTAPTAIESQPMDPMPEAPEVPQGPELSYEEAQMNADMYGNRLNETRYDDTTVPLPTMPGKLLWQNPDQPDAELFCEYPILLDEGPVNSGEVAPPDTPIAPDSIVVGGGNYISASYHQTSNVQTEAIPRYIGSQSGNSDGTVRIDVLDTKTLVGVRFEPGETIVALHGSSDRAIFDSRVEAGQPLVYATDYDGQHLTDDNGNYVLPGMMNGYK